MKKLSKNILVGRLGFTVKFTGFKIGTQTSCDTDMMVYSLLSQLNPDYNFYFIGPNDLVKLSDDEYNEIFPNHNVYSAWDRKLAKEKDFSKIVSYFTDKNIKVDFALLNTGCADTVCVPNFYPRKDGKPRTLRQSEIHYMAPYIYTLNHIGCPVYCMADDARNILLNFRDLCNRERKVFTQGNYKLETITHVTSMDDFTLKTDIIDCVYAHIERIDLIGMPDNWRDRIDLERKLNSPKERHIVVISHGQGTKRINGNTTIKDARLPGYKEYIIDNLKDTIYNKSKIYGKWTDEVYQKYPDNFEDKPMIELDDILKDARYSLVYSQVRNFVTVKPWEMIANGIVPFIHPDYDPEHILGLPDYVYLKDAEDFKNKVIELDNNPESYLKVINECMDCIKKEDRDGTFINNFILKTIGEDLGFEYEEKKDVNIKFVNHNYNNMHI
jgi:hypothetical protein